MDPRFLAGQDLENSVSGDYTVLVGENSVGDSRRSGLVKGLIYAVLLGLSIGLVVVLIAGDYDGEMQKSIVGSGFSPATKLRPAIRGVEKGVSKKSVGLSFTNDFPWTNDMLSWQRTAFHFQPEKNWMNDPNGPLYYKGWYHLFYQYNPDSAVWGNITWGHAISRDLIHWLYLPLAMVPDRWFDIDGVWTGSATVLPNGTIVMLYTGSTAESVQVQNLAIPADPYDPLLRNWVKYHKNPVILPPAGIGKKDFRDPTTAWITPDGTWRIAIGSKLNRTGITLIYKTTDFIKYELVDGIMHGVPGTGMWECVDFYPVSTRSRNGLDTSANGPGVKHVLKASMDDDRNDYYAIGSYNDKKDTWSPDIDTEDVGIGKRYDYGKFYASKTFYDQRNRRRILWGWIGESDSERADVMKGWASVLAVPREVLFDQKTGTNLLQWPVKEVESLRSSSYEFHNVSVGCGSVMPLNIGTSTQVDVTAEFQIGKEALEMISEFEGEEYNCETGGGAAGRGRLGPFGFLVLADQSRSEQTAVYFYVGKSSDGNLQSFFCQDETRSSKANDIVKKVYGSLVPVLNGENLTVRILVDHSIIESFAQRGRTCITSRVYPTEANNGGARLFLFNNATVSTITAVSVKIWQMKSAVIHPYTA